MPVQLQEERLPGAGAISAATAPTAPIAPTAPTAATAPTLPPLPTISQATVPKLPELSPEQTVSGRLTKLTTQQSPLLKTAETRARQRAAGRGLLSSTLAEQAGTQAVIETATPIAQQESAAESRRIESEFQAQQQAESEARQAQQRRDELLFSTTSQAQQAQLEREQQAANVKFQGEQAIFLQENAEFLRQGGLSDERIQQVHGTYIDTIANTNGFFDKQILAIQNAPDSEYPDKEGAINQVNEMRETSILNTNAAYKSLPQWDTSWEILPTTPEPTATPEGTAPTSVTAPSAGGVDYQAVEPKTSFSSPEVFQAVADKVINGTATDDEKIRVAAHMKDAWADAQSDLTDAQAAADAWKPRYKKAIFGSFGAPDVETEGSKSEAKRLSKALGTAQNAVDALQPYADSLGDAYGFSF